MPKVKNTTPSAEEKESEMQANIKKFADRWLDNSREELEADAAYALMMCKRTSAARYVDTAWAVENFLKAFTKLAEKEGLLCREP